MYVDVAMEPERRKVGGWKSSNHSVTSEGGEEVKRRPTWPFRFYMIENTPLDTRTNEI